MLLIAVVCTITSCDRLNWTSGAITNQLINWENQQQRLARASCFASRCDWLFRLSPFLLKGHKCSSKRTSLDPPHPPPPPPPTRLASLVQMESSLSGCLRRRRMFITEEAWSRARQHQANSTDDTTSELSEEDWEPALGSTIDKRHVWLRISEKGDALAELFVCLFVCFWSSRCPSSPSFVGFVWWLKGVMVGRNYSNVAIIWYFSTKGLFQGREFNQEAAAIIQRKLVTSKTLNVPSFEQTLFQYGLIVETKWLTKFNFPFFAMALRKLQNWHI